MSKRKRPKAVQPDEFFSKGPLSVARFGKNVVFQSDWPEGAFAEAQEQLLKDYPKVVQEIEQLVADIAQQVAELPAEQLLHRAWWEMAHRHLGVESEAQLNTDDAVSVRMIDYIQSIIAAVPPAAKQHKEISEDAWTSLRKKVEDLFFTLNGQYQICLSAKNKAEDPEFNEGFEEFKFKAQIYWCNVRGDRYQVHEPVYLRDMFLPHSDVLQELFGLTGEQFAEAIMKIWHALSFGFRDAFEALERFQKDTTSALKAKMAGKTASSEAELKDLMAEVISEHGWEKRQQEVFGQLIGADLFDLQKITALPQRLLKELTWSPGEEQEFFSEGEFCGWPLRIWPIFRRPFIRLDGRYYCFDLYSLFDNLYRVMQRIVLRLKPDYRETWNKIQNKLSEGLPLKYLEDILPGATVFRSAQYQWRTGSGEETNWCETDGLFLYDDHLIILEARGGAFTYTPPATDFPAYVTSLKNLVLKPAKQGERFLEYLNSADSVPIFDANHKKIGKLYRSKIRHVTICPVTLDPFTELAAQVQHLRKIGVDIGAQPVWAISLDDLRVYADIFENPLVFLHFIEQRMRAYQSEIVQSDDELDHLGLYLAHNNYSLHAKEMQGESDARITFIGYRSDIDKFFYERMLDPRAPCPLKQKTPPRILEAIDLLAGSDQPGRTEVSSYMLDLSGDTQELLSSSIDEELARQPNTKRPKPFSTHGDVNLTLFCWTKAWAPRNSPQALAHARKVLLINGDDRRLLLEASFSDQGEFQDLSWCWVDQEGIPARELPKLLADAEILRRERVATAKSLRRKIGRNEPCPCGSGKKYKKCCLET